MLKKTLVSLAVTGALHISSLHALELGELTPISKVNEPFKAEIQLNDSDQLNPTDISVQLGSESEFQQAKIIPERVLSRLKFEVKKANDGSMVVDIISLAPLEVEQLDFVLSATWPSGKVVRRYQVPLKDSVLVEEEKTKVIKSAPVAPAVDVKKETVTFTDPREAAKNALNSLPTDGTYNVKQGNTLWVIANNNLSSNQLTIYQTMMAIQALNEDAFYANNVNLLKEGAVLRLPTKEQIALFNAIMSKKEFDRQTEAWKGLKQAGRIAKEIEAAQLNTQAKSKPAAKVAPEKGDVLSLITGASLLPEKTSNTNEGEEKAKAAIAELEGKLTAAEENLDKESREKAELSDQLQELNNQLATLEELIALKDAQLAELQQQFVAAQNAMQEQKNTIDQLLEADQLRREKELEEANTFINKFLNNPLYLSITSVLLLLLGIMVGLLLRRGGKKEEADNYLTDDLSDFNMSDTAAEAAPAPKTEEVATSNDLDDIDDDLEDEDPFAFDFEDPDDELDDLNTELDEDVADDDFEEIEEIDEFEEDELELDFDMDDDENLEDTNTIDDINEDDIPTVDNSADDDLDADEDFLDEVPTLDEPEVDDLSTDSELEEEEFVSNLLDDSDLEEGPDESALFEGEPSDSIANSIEETLSESMGEDEDMPAEFTAEDAAEGTEESDEEENIDFFDASGDEMATKLDLARAYVDMGDEEGAKTILDDVLEKGNEDQIKEAQDMIDRMSLSEEE
ncbi:pilus assembly protein FimV [Marinomonas agarivorans]|nr:pilus assembly protein FimV [Marinomonas agarivorans]